MLMPTPLNDVPSFRQVLGLALPQMGLMLCHLAISLTDMWVAGRIDASVQAAMGVVGQVYMIMVLVTSLVGGGCMSTISQALGGGLRGRARRYAALVLLLGAATGGLTAACGLAAVPFVCARLADTPELIPPVGTFMRVYCLQWPFYYVMVMCNSVFRAYRLMHLPLITLAFVAVLNTGGSLGFGLGWWGLPDYGYAGVAWSTFASALLGLGINLTAAFRKGILGKGSFPSFRWAVKAAPYLFRVGSPMALSQLIQQTGSLVILALLTALPGKGVSVVAGMTLGNRVTSAITFPVEALTLTLVIISGHLLGAGRRDKLYTYGISFALRGGAFFLLLAGGLYVFRRQAASLLGMDEGVLDSASLFLAYASAGLPFMVCSGLLGGVFTGTGATLAPCLAGLVSMWLVRVPLAVFLAWGLHLEEHGVYTAMLISWIFQAAAYFYLYRRGKWLESGLRKRHTGAQAATAQ